LAQGQGPSDNGAAGPFFITAPDAQPGRTAALRARGRGKAASPLPP
jgi:hypothetical protein